MNVTPGQGSPTKSTNLNQPITEEGTQQAGSSLAQEQSLPPPPPELLRQQGDGCFETPTDIQKYENVPSVPHYQNQGRHIIGKFFKIILFTLAGNH